MLHGEIISFDEASGTIIFKDKEGRRYSFNGSDYKYFKENEVVSVKGRGQRQRALHPRKNSGFDIQLGFSGSAQNVTHNFKADDYHLSTWEDYSDWPMGIRLGLGMQVDSVHYIGGVVDLAFSTYNKSINAAGVRYVYRYPAPKRNAAFYLPLEAKFTSVEADLEFEINEAVPGQSWHNQRPIYDLAVTSWEISLGQGVQWGLPNKRAVSAEVAILSHFGMKHTFEGIATGQEEPDSDFQVSGLRFALVYHL